jgi:hypothetical protein
MSDAKEDFGGPNAEAEMIAYIEETERLRQLRDEAYIRAFWAFKSPERVL